MEDTLLNNILTIGFFAGSEPIFDQLVGTLVTTRQNLNFVSTNTSTRRGVISGPRYCCPIILDCALITDEAAPCDVRVSVCTDSELAGYSLRRTTLKDGQVAVYLRYNPQMQSGWIGLYCNLLSCCIGKREKPNRLARVSNWAA